MLPLLPYAALFDPSSYLTASPALVASAEGGPISVGPKTHVTAFYSPLLRLSHDPFTRAYCMSGRELHLIFDGHGCCPTSTYKKPHLPSKEAFTDLNWIWQLSLTLVATVPSGN